MFHGDETFPESLGNAGNSDLNFESIDAAFRPGFSSNARGSAEISQSGGNAGILLGSVGNAGGSDVTFESPDDALCPGSLSNVGGSAENSQSGGSDESFETHRSGNVGSASGKSKLSPDGEGVPGSSNSSSDEEMSEEFVVNMHW